MEILRVLIVDDEPLARRGLAMILGQIPAVELVGHAKDGDEALELVKTLKPNVILLDISMPGRGGFETVEELAEDGPVVIFVTAFNHFAIRAFEVNAVDYVLKPVAMERLRAALDKARMRLQQDTAEQRIAELSAVVDALRRGAEEPASRRYHSEIWVQHRGERVRVPVERINWIEAEREYVRLHTERESFLLRESISHLEEILDPQMFLRVRRSAIVRRDRIVAVRQAGFGAIAVQLSSGINIRVGRTYVTRVRELFEAPR